jgi:outer membrane protein assembly factor BamB
VSPETGLALDWGEGGPAVLWRVPLGAAYSGLSVVEGRLYTMESRDGREHVVALDVADGARVWSVEIGPAWDDRWSRGPRSTPTVHDGRVYAVGSRGRLVALDAEDGTTRWSVDLVERYGGDVPRWGVATSPLVHGGRLFVPVGGEQVLAMAFHPDNGREVWRAGAGGGAGYSSPVAIEAAGLEQILLFTADGLVSVAPRSGARYWSFPWETSYDVNATAPLPVPPDRVFVSSGYDKGAAMLRIVARDGGVGVEQIWRNREMKNRFSTSVRVGDHLYGFDEQTFKCVDARNGEMVWRERGLGHGSLIAADGRLVVLGEKGQLRIVEASPAGYREVAAWQAFDGKTWTAPSLADGVVYLRDEREVLALDVRKQPVKPAENADPGAPASVP